MIYSEFVSTLWPKTEENEPVPIEIDGNGNMTPPTKMLEKPVKSMKIRLHVRKDRDHETLRKIFGTVRWTYNKSVKRFRKKEERPNKLTYCREFVNLDSPAVKKHPWLAEVCYDIRERAVNDFFDSLKGNWTKIKNGTIKKFDFKYRSKKKQNSETFYVRHQWIRHKTPHSITIKLPNMKKMVFWIPKNSYNGPILMDCIFQRKWTGEYSLCIPHIYEVENQDHLKNIRVCSIDPGVRTFNTIYDVTGNCAYEIAPGDMNRIVRLCISADKLTSKRDKAPNARKRYSYKRALRRHLARIRSLVNETHKQLAKFIATNYDLVMIPKFETSQMIKKGARKICSSTVRQMLKWAHYRFRMKLLFKCRQYGCKVAFVNESWTSKTCSSCGFIDHKLGGKKVFSCPQCKMIMDRDINGAKNIFLKNYEALGLHLALGPTPCSSNCCTETAMSSLNDYTC